MLSIDPIFQKWLNSRKKAQKNSQPIPTQNANPTSKAGPKNSLGNSKKTSVRVSHNSNAKATKTVSKVVAGSVVKTGVPKLKTSKSVGRPAGKVRATNNPNLNARKG